ncbi:uncharacterized protein LOC135834156 [Planococcus citri]|uniref:uncharacterized protein LOC135834156 n=1 Tax=Planococcus citri TaxID=170843 RepID=UPI0031F8E2E1
MNEEFINELKTMMNDVKEIMSTVKSTDAKVADFTERMSKVENDNKEIKKNYEKLQDQLNDLNQYSRIENIIINGIPQNEDENIRALVMLVAEKLNVTLYEYDISTAHRLPCKPDKTPAIIARLNNRDKKSEMITNSRILRINCKDLNLASPAPIFVNEHLTSRNMAIHRQALHLKKLKIITRVHVKEGKVLIQEEDNGIFTRISHLSQLSLLEPDKEENVQLKSSSSENDQVKQRLRSNSKPTLTLSQLSGRHNRGGSRSKSKSRTGR